MSDTMSAEQDDYKTSRATEFKFKGCKNRSSSRPHRFHYSTDRSFTASYSVVTAASPYTFDYCRRLGASSVFDYRSPTVKQDVIAALRWKGYIRTSKLMVIISSLSLGGLVADSASCSPSKHCSNFDRIATFSSWPRSRLLLEPSSYS